MIILGIETSCDETAAAVLEKTGNRIQILSNVIASSASLQAKYGGIIPEQAAREQIKSIIPVIEEALKQAFPEIKIATSSPMARPRNDGGGIDAIAVTYGPGLIGSLLVGVETAKTLSLVWDKPLIPVNHLLGHFWANWISPSSLRGVLTTKQSNSEKEIATLRQAQGKLPRNDDFDVPRFPCIGLLVSGGHTDLVLFKSEQDWEYLGGTRDDAAGECFDKCARLLGLPYPGGPEIARLAQNGDPKAFDLPRPMLHSKDFSSKGRPAFGWDFSFSGLKTAVANTVQSSEFRVQNEKQKKDLCASIEQAIVDVLVDKTIRAAKLYKVEHIMIAGGVASNQKLTSDLESRIKNLELRIQLHVPPANLCTDNAAMIASRGFFGEAIDPLKLQAEPGLGLD